MFLALLKDEAGVIVSAELVLVLTIAVLAMIVGLNEVAVAVNTELDDISNAIGKLNQTYSYSGYRTMKNGAAAAEKNTYAGGLWNDATDDCDACSGTSAIVCAAGTPSSEQ